MGKAIREVLRIEECFYLLFFFGLFVASLMHGEWFFRSYADRFTYFFGILLVLLLSWKGHRSLFRMKNMECAALWDEFTWVFDVSRDIFNLYMCLAMYSSLAPLLRHLPVKDKWIVDFEFWLFGKNPLLALEPCIHPFLTKTMVVAYLAFLFYLPLLTLYFLIRGRSREMRQFMASLSMALVIGYGGYLIIPAVGPSVFQAKEFTVSLWSNTPVIFQEALNAVIDVNRLPKDCFPSMHVCLSVLSLIFAWRFAPGLFLLFLPGVTGLICSTMYLRYHYVTDVAAGFILALFTSWFGPRILENWKPSQRAGPSFVANPPAPEA